MQKAVKRLLGAAVLLLGGCMSWTPGWQNAPIISPADQKERATSLAEADALFDAADDEARVRGAVAAYEALLGAAPDDRRLLNRLAGAHVLFGAAYATSAAEKGRWYRAGIRYAERAMAQNDAFAARVASGGSIGVAVEALGPEEEEMRAMLLWVTGVSYYFKECTGPRALIYFRWMLRTKEVMERMLTLDPDFEHGAVLFSLGIYNLALPPGAGRDMVRSEEFLTRAVAASGTSLLPRWGRAKYFHARTGNDAAFVEDLQWVIAQNPRAPGSPYAWNVYFQRAAKAMLAAAGAGSSR